MLLCLPHSLSLTSRTSFIVSPSGVPYKLPIKGTMHNFVSYDTPGVDDNGGRLSREQMTTLLDKLVAQKMIQLKVGAQVRTHHPLKWSLTSISISRSCSSKTWMNTLWTVHWARLSISEIPCPTTHMLQKKTRKNQHRVDRERRNPPVRCHGPLSSSLWPEEGSSFNQIVGRLNFRMAKSKLVVPR